jgi:seryl-tRNA synthetase
MASSIIKSFERVKTKLFFENEGSGKYNQDPMDELINTRQVIETYPGVYALQGDILETINELDSIFKTYAIERNAIEQHFQPTLPVKSLIENGYISSFPHHPLFVASVVRDADHIRNLSKDAKEKSKESMHQWLDDKLDMHKQVLSPTVCYHCFETLRDQSIPVDGAQYTAIAPCYRNESRNIKGLSRLQTFTMREIVFFGTVDFVETKRNEILSHCKSYLVDLGLKFRIVTASDPFFTSGAEAKRIYQSALALKYEIQTYLPHSDTWISVASFNNHQQSLVTSYKIGFDSNSDLYSGCVGYGYERLAYALYSQFGCDQSSWLLN